MPSLILNDQTFTLASPGPDQAVLVVGSQEPDSRITNCVVDASIADWGLKMSGNTGSVFTRCRFTGGKERALDMVQGSNVRFDSCSFYGGTTRVPITSYWCMDKRTDIGIKGGVNGVTFDSCMMSDILLGDHSIYDNPHSFHTGLRTTGISLINCIHPKGVGTPIILRVLNAEPPMITGTNVSILRYWPVAVKAYFTFAGTFIDSRKPTSP